MDKKILRVNNFGLKEECGVVAVYSLEKEDVAFNIYTSLIALQHRGQDSAGIAVFDGKKINCVKNLGLVSEAIKKEDLEELKGYMGIGHVRYPTIGAGGIADAQPFVAQSSIGQIALAHNGNISNYGIRRKMLEEKGVGFCSSCDAELILNHFISCLKNSNNDIYQSLEKLMQELDGAYSTCAISSKGKLIVFRDPNAIRPLCWGENSKLIMFASESVALDVNSVPLKGDVNPGEVVVVENNKIEKKIVAKKTSNKNCIFEYVYFSRPDSIQNNKLIYNIRYEMGRRLAMRYPTKADIIVPVPDTSRIAAQGYSDYSKIPIVEGLMKNRYIGRTFIMPNKKRALAVSLKLNAVRPLIENKELIVIDDSIVRGTTAGPIISLLKKNGAKKIHFRVACPPIIAPCFYGVDLPTYEELIASKKSVEEIRKEIGADSLAYLTIEDLIASIGKKEQELCLGCLTGKYPTAHGQKLADLIKTRKRKEDLRIWEEKIV